MAYPLSPEEEVMGAIGARTAAPKASFNVVGALQAGFTPADIADFLAPKKNFNIKGAREAGFTDEQIVAALTGETGFSAGVKRLVESGGSSIKGIAQLAGVADTERLRAERQAAEIASANNPYIGGTAEFAGAVLDPVALPAWAVAPLRGATLAGTFARQGAAQGALGGYLEPVLREDADTGAFSADRFKGAGVGTVAGFALGGVLGKGAEAIVNRLSRDAGDATKAADDALASKEASTAAITDVAKAIDPDYETPAYLRRTGGRGVEATNVSPRASAILDENQTRLINERITKTEAELARAEEELFDVQRGAAAKEAPDLLGLREPKKTETTRQVPSLFQPTGKTPQDFGLLPKTQEGNKQVASLLQGASKEEKKQVLETAQTSSSVAYLEKNIAEKKAEVERLKGFLTRSDEAANQKTFPVVKEQQTMPAETQAVLERNGFKTMEEANVALGKTSNQPLTYEEATRMPTSGGAAATRPENLFADAEVFPSVGTATQRLAAGDKATQLKREEVNIPELESKMSQFLSFFGKDLKKMRESGNFSGTLKGTTEAGDALIRRGQREEGSIFAYFFKQNEDGDYVNFDKTWNRADVAAYAPVVQYAEKLYNKIMDDAVELRRAGKLTDDALDNIAYQLQFPTQVMAVLQGKRTEASRTLNAFKILKGRWDNNKPIEGLMPNTPC